MTVTIAELDTPQVLLDLDVVDTNLRTMQAAARDRNVGVRVHFKSFKCAGLAKHLIGRGVNAFCAAKVNEAETLADAGAWDILIANQVVGAGKIARVIELAKRSNLHVLVDHADQIAPLAEATRAADVPLGVLVEVDIGMARCGVAPGDPVVDLARAVRDAGLRFDGLQGYDGHLQMLEDAKQRRLSCHQGLKALIATRDQLEREGFEIPIVTGGGTGTWEFVAGYPGVTEIQPGSFLLMDAAYHNVRSEFACALSILTTVISVRGPWYVADAGSKAISKDFGMPVVKDRPQETVARLSEEHTKVECDVSGIRIGDRRRIIPSHCCATMNLHRKCVAVRGDRIEAFWPIEASGRYD